MRQHNKAVAFAEEFRTIQNTETHRKALMEACDKIQHFAVFSIFDDEISFRFRVGSLVSHVIQAKKIDAFRIAFAKAMLMS